MTTNDPCARPMPDTPAPGEERRTVCVYDKLDPDYVFRPDDAGEYRMQVDRRSETRPAPMPDTKLCGAVTQAGEGRKFRTCELPSGHEGRHKSHLGGETVWWENTGPECEHGHLARVCVTCELIAAEARVAELEALVQQLCDEDESGCHCPSGWCVGECGQCKAAGLPNTAPGKEPTSE